MLDQKAHQVFHGSNLTSMHEGKDPEIFCDAYFYLTGFNIMDRGPLISSSLMRALVVLQGVRAHDLLLCLRDRVQLVYSFSNFAPSRSLNIADRDLMAKYFRNEIKAVRTSIVSVIRGIEFSKLDLNEQDIAALMGDIEEGLSFF
jgi:hypothetical protein